MWAGDGNGMVSSAMCLVAWQKVCSTKELGGLGIKDIATQNICLLLKLVHKLHFARSSAWAQWVRSRACIASLKGDLHGEHWEVMRTILPLYQAVTTVAIGNGQHTSFWMDAWLGDDALADRFPALFSHCTKKEASVQEIVDNGLTGAFVSRLSNVASAQLQSLQELLSNATLTDQPDSRISPCIDPNGKLDTGSINRLLKARGQAHNDQAAYIWNNKAPHECNSLCGFYATNEFSAAPTS